MKKNRKEEVFKLFIEVSKNIIDEEGVEYVSARKIGERSGYSYATIYNYFKDINELLAYCAYDYLKDCGKEIMKVDLEGLTWIEILMAQLVTYTTYFANHHDYFNLVFVRDFSTYPLEIPLEDDDKFVGEILFEHLMLGVKEGFIQENQIKLISQMLVSSIHGKLLFLNGKRHEVTLDEVIKTLKEEVMFMIGHN